MWFYDEAPNSHTPEREKSIKRQWILDSYKLDLKYNFATHKFTAWITLENQLTIFSFSSFYTKETSQLLKRQYLLDFLKCDGHKKIICSLIFLSSALSALSDFLKYQLLLTNFELLHVVLALVFYILLSPWVFTILTIFVIFWNALRLSQPTLPFLL
jgi:hypothetical protein